MSQPLSDYFAQEAGEFLDQLDALLASPGAPDPLELFRLARGVRGSAQIAGAQAIVPVAERLEDGARGLRDGALAWSGDVPARVADTVADLRALVQGHERWGAAEDERARRAVERWEGTAHGRRGAAPGAAPDQLLVFLRREMGGVVAEMDRVLGELAAAPASREPLRAVLRRMRPVRGVAGMDSLSPVLELLEGIEDAAHEVLSRAVPVQARSLELLRAGRDALAASADALERHGAVGESPELVRFRELRDTAEGEDADADAGVVPVSRFFYDDAGPHVLSSPLAPVPERPTVPGSLAADVESFLRIEATGFLDRAEGLISGLSRRPARFSRIARQLADLAGGVGDLAVTYGMEMVARAADEAASRLGGTTNAEEARAALLRLRGTLPGAAPLAAVEVEPETEPDDAAPSRPAEPSQVAADGADAVPVEALLYDPDDALREAVRLRPRIEALAGPGARRGSALGDALDELFALVSLGLESRAGSRG